jgi:NADH-quinone oxidoreductase subunit L
MIEWLLFLIPMLGAAFVLLTKAYRTAPLFTLASFVIAVMLLGSNITWVVQWLPFSSFGIRVDELSSLFAAVVAFVSTIALWYSLRYMRDEEGLERFYPLMLFFAGSMTGLVLSSSLLEMFVFWEAVGLCSYLLIGLMYKNPEAGKAADKAFLVTRIGDVALLAGILLLFHATGSFDLSVIMGSSIPQSLLSLVAVLTVIGILAKAAQFPFHIWLPDAMEGPIPVSALLHSATMVQAGVYLAARMYPLFSSVGAWDLLAYFGALSVLIGGIFALTSNDLKKILAYSTISQTGYMFIVVVASGAGVAAGLFHFMSHAIFKSLLFLCAGNIMFALGTRDITKMGGLRRSMPYTFLLFAFGILALAAIPPLNGFWSKEAITESLHDPLLGLIVDIGFVLTLMYAMRVFYLVFFGEPRGDAAKEAPLSMLVPPAFLAAATVLSAWMIPWFSLRFGTFLPSAIIATPFVLIPVGFALAYLFYEHVPESEKQRIWNVAGAVDSLYTAAASGSVDLSSRVIGAVEAFWDRANDMKVDFVLGARSGWLGSAIECLSGLTPEQWDESMVIIVVGVMVVMVILL